MMDFTDWSEEISKHLKQAQKELRQQLEQLAQENEALKQRVTHLEEVVAKYQPVEEESFKATATKISRPGGANKIS